MYLFRIHIRPNGGCADISRVFDYCLKNGILGVGWRVSGLQGNCTWEEYYAKASLIHQKLQVCSYINEWVSEGDLFWTRDTRGQYYLARAESGWMYFTTPEAEEHDIDIANAFRCSFQKVDLDSVPGKVVASFRAPRSIQEIRDPRALAYSQHLWNTGCDSNIYAVDRSVVPDDIFTLLDDEETEDLVFLYLQKLGWYIVPNSRKADTMSFEYYLVDPRSEELAVVQVKTGNSAINRDEYTEPRRVFLFQPNNCYVGAERPNITSIPKVDILAFLNGAITWLPKIFRTKLALVASMRSNAGPS